MDRLVVPFKQWHMDWLLAEGEAEAGKMPFAREVWAQLERHNNHTIVIDGTPIACGGTIEQWPGRHVAWSLLALNSGRYMRFVTGVARQVLSRAVGRLEMTVRMDFDAGHRWAEILGFEIETPLLRGYGPEGEDHRSYVRFNKGVG